MRMRLPLILLLVLSAGALCTANSARRLAGRRENVEAALHNLSLTQDKVNDVEALRGRHARVDTQRRPTQDVIAQVNAILAETGIGSDHLKALEAESDVAVDGTTGRTGYRRQSLSLSLEDLQPGELGQFLEQFRKRQKVWVASRIEVFHRRSRQAVTNRYDTRMVLTATYLSDELPEASR